MLSTEIKAPPVPRALPGRPERMAPPVLQALLAPRDPTPRASLSVKTMQPETYRALTAAAARSAKAA